MACICQYLVQTSSNCQNAIIKGWKCSSGFSSQAGAYNAETFSQRQIDLSSPQVQASAQLSIKIQSSKAGLISSSQDSRVFNGRVMTASLKKNLLLSDLTSETISTAKKHTRQSKLIASSLMKFLYGYSLDVKRCLQETILKEWKWSSKNFIKFFSFIILYQTLYNSTNCCNDLES